MSPRKTILRELDRRSRDGDSGFVRPSELPGYEGRADRYHQAVNDLLKDRLIDGHRDGGGQMVIAINTHRSVDVAKELRSWWGRPAVWAAATVIIALGVGAYLAL